MSCPRTVKKGTYQYATHMNSSEQGQVRYQLLELHCLPPRFTCKVAHDAGYYTDNNLQYNLC
ncbi:hypothetical protein LIPSTDRAFT_72930 [Lipomyces starkeyi NRRL Y-11557]|uniref:Uncharacterized protein n=1 Tax=Lipomyces starkeyi NRRL Y-11557 TaxID=675824 RepID=A0A1E3Q3S7_LIPST|nr:hypothetical protein LIPSTDRAFT_72930 [Lipomyces starkeyi NRRL Y-11557]